MLAADLHRIETLYGQTELIKDAQVNPDLASVVLNRLPDYAFADAERTLPIHTKQAAYLSNARFWEGAILDDTSSLDTGRNLLQAAKLFNIRQEVGTILQKVATQAVLKQLADFGSEDVALTTVGPDGREVKLYPVVDAATVKMAAESLYADRMLLPFTWRRQAAEKIMEKLAEYNVYLDDEKIADYIERAAGRGISSSTAIADGLLQRAATLKQYRQSELAGQVEKVAARIRTQKSSRALSLKTAEVVDRLDAESKLYQQYQNGLPLPEELCHTVLLKHAQAELDQYVRLPSGGTYRREDIARCPEALQVLPTSAVGHLTKVAALNLEQLTPEWSATLERALQAGGVQPVTLSIDLRDFV